MTNIVQTVVTGAEDIFKTVEADAVVAWDDFLGGIKYLATEAAALAKWAESVDPAIGTQIQALITVGETAASTLAGVAAPALQNLISGGVDLAEQAAANLIQSATGNSPLGVSATALTTAGLADLGTIASSTATVGFTKALAALTAAAQPITAVAAPAPPQ